MICLQHFKHSNSAALNSINAYIANNSSSQLANNLCQYISTVSDNGDIIVMLELSNVTIVMTAKNVSVKNLQELVYLQWGHVPH